MPRIWKHSSLLPLACALAGCGGGDDDDGSDGSVQLKEVIAVDGVQGFLLSGEARFGQSRSARSLRTLADGKRSTDVARLYAIASDGALVETTVVDGVDPTDTRYVPQVMADSPKYVLFGFELLVVGTAGGSGSQDCPLLLLRKSDGALFCVPGVSGFTGQVQTDAGGDLIYVNSPQTLFRIDATDPAYLSVEALIETTSESALRTWITNADGDLFASFGGDDQLRVYKAAGGLQNIANAAEDCMTRGLSGEPGGFYYSINMPPDGIFVHRLVRETDGSFRDESAGIDASNPYTGCETALVTGDRVYVRPTGNQAPNHLIEFINPDLSFTRHEIAELTELERAVGVGSTVFILGDDELGNSGIVRFDAVDAAQTTVMPPGEFTLSAIDLSESGELTFTGMRNSDGKLIVGNVAAGSDAYHIVNESAPETAAVVRIQ